MKKNRVGNYSCFLNYPIGLCDLCVSPELSLHSRRLSNHHVRQWQSRASFAFLTKLMIWTPPGHGGDGQQSAAAAGPGGLEGAEHERAAEGCHHAAGHRGAGRLRPR